jgi:hypothetical protein
MVDDDNRVEGAMLVGCEHCGKPSLRDENARPPHRCPHCGGIEGQLDTPAPLPRNGAVLTPPLEGPGFWPVRAARTVVVVLRHPFAFFASLPREGGAQAGLLGFVCVLLGHIGHAAWALALLPSTRGVALQALADAQALATTSQHKAELAELLHQMGELEPALWLELLIAPLTALFALHLVTGLVHVSCRAFAPPPDDDEAPATYEDTWRAASYGMVPMVLGLVPIVGGLSSLWTVFTLAIAMTRVHRLRFSGVVLGVLLPSICVSMLWGLVLREATPPALHALGIVVEDPVLPPPTTTTTPPATTTTPATPATATPPAAPATPPVAPAATP